MNAGCRLVRPLGPPARDRDRRDRTGGMFVWYGTATYDPTQNAYPDEDVDAPNIGELIRSTPIELCRSQSRAMRGG